MRRLIVELSKIAVVVVVASTIAGFLGAYWWIFELFSHFRVQYSAALVCTSFVLIFTKSPRITLVSFAGLVINLALIWPYFVGQTVHAEGSKPSFRVMTINVYTANKEYRAVENWIRKVEPEILVLTESDSIWLKELETLHQAFPYRKVVPRSDNFGIALFSRYPFERAEVVEFGANAVPSILAEYRFGDSHFFVIGTHPVPPRNISYAAGHERQVQAMAEYIRELAKPIIVIGDLNMSPWASRFSKFIDTTGLRDSSIGFGLHPTWPQQMPLLQIPIDHILVSKEFTVHNKEVGPSVGSDHYPLHADISLLMGELL